MKHKIIVFLSFTITFIAMGIFSNIAHAKADFFNYPCSPPGQGTGVDIKVIVDASGQFCDGPTQINLTHLHCDSGGASVQGSGVGLGSIPFLGGSALSVGGIGGGAIGGGGQGCTYKCPDGTPAPQPNPPWTQSNIPYLDVNRIIKANKAFCVVGNHLLAQGPTSELVRPEEGDPDLYNNKEPDLIPHPAPPNVSPGE